MKNHCNLKNKKEYTKYKLAFNIFCRRFHIPENSSLWIKYNPGFKFTDNDGNKLKTSDRITIGSYDDGKSVKIDNSKRKSKNFIKNKLTENKLKLPSGYSLIHTTNKNSLHQLKPVSYSNNYISSGPGGLGGQYHQTGRIYFTLVKDKKLDDSAKSYGKHVYKLVTKVSEIYFDSEHSSCYKNNMNMNNLDIEKLVNKPVYVKTNIPLKVKQIK